MHLNVRRVIEEHPSLGHAANLVAAAVNEEVAKGGGSSGGHSSASRGEFVNSNGYLQFE